MQERRYRPGDVLDDYCPRERRITDHAIVAMIENEIQKTRCGSCDAEHEYKQGKVPSPRRKTPPPALFTQVLDGLQGPTARPPAPAVSDTPDIHDEPIVSAMSTDPTDKPAPVPMAAASESTPPEPPSENENADDDREEGPIRRSLIRATFPKVEGQVPTPRALPEFTIQSLNNRNNRPGGSRPGGGKNRRRRPGGGGGSQDHIGPMRFREHNGGNGGQGSQGGGRPFGQGDHRQHGQGQGQGQGQGGRRRRRGGGGGGKKTS